MQELCYVLKEPLGIKDEEAISVRNSKHDGLVPTGQMFDGHLYVLPIDNLSEIYFRN